MARTITNLLLLTILIPIIKTKEAKIDHKNLKDKDFNDSRPTNDIYDQNINDDTNSNNDDNSKHTESKQNNTFNRNSKPKMKEKNKNEHQNGDQDEDSQSNEVDEQINSEYPNLVTKDKKFIEYKTTELNNSNEKAFDKSHRINDHTTFENEMKHKNNNTSLKENQNTSKPQNKDRQSHLNKPTTVTDNDFPYMATIMKGATYLSAGTLIDESWVLTAASGIHLMRETIRFVRVRLGSINYKRGGTLLPIKYLETHPHFNSSKPAFDLALIMLSKPVRYTASMRPVRLQLTPKEVTTTHFIMTSWHGFMKSKNQSADGIKHRRMLSMTHLHPSDSEECAEELMDMGIHDGVMCFSGVEDGCLRDIGAPVVINGVLWGVLSSWKPDDCDDEDFIFATLVSDKNVGSWIHATLHGRIWHPKSY